MTTHPDLPAILAAVDAGDDGVLPILADLLEEMGDRRAAGLRASQVGDALCPVDLVRHDTGHRWGWLTDDEGSAGGAFLAPGVFARLRGGKAYRESKRWLASRGYPTRSAAYLALAEALAAPEAAPEAARV